MLRGIAAHAECAAIYGGAPLKKDATSLLHRDWRYRLAAQVSAWGSDLEAELQVAFDAQWQRREWYASDTVFRCAFDGFGYAGGDVMIYEHKTGRVRASHQDQAEVYACVANVLLPEAPTVRVNIQYLDLPVSRAPTVHSWTAAELMVGNNGRPLLTKWTDAAAAMMADRDYPTRSGPQCRWCPFRRDIGGPCEI
jgi:hypothetical protein